MAKYMYIKFGGKILFYMVVWVVVEVVVKMYLCLQ